MLSRIFWVFKLDNKECIPSFMPSQFKILLNFLGFKDYLVILSTFIYFSRSFKIN